MLTLTLKLMAIGSSTFSPVQYLQHSTKMETTFISIEQAFDTTNDARIIAKKTAIVKGIIYLVAGFICILILPFVKTESGTGSALVISLAIIFIIVGMIATFIRRRFYYYLPTESKIYFKELYFEHVHYQRIKKDIETNSYSELAKIPQSIDKGVKVRIAYTTDAEFCVVQLHSYVPYEYVARTETKELTKQQSKEFVSALMF